MDTYVKQSKTPSNTFKTVNNIGHFKIVNNKGHLKIH